MLASRARDLVSEIRVDLGLAGVDLSAQGGSSGERYWDVFCEAIEQTLTSLEPDLTSVFGPLPGPSSP